MSYYNYMMKTNDEQMLYDAYCEQQYERKANGLTPLTFKEWNDFRMVTERMFEFMAAKRAEQLNGKGTR